MRNAKRLDRKSPGRDAGFCRNPACDNRLTTCDVANGAVHCSDECCIQDLAQYVETPLLDTIDDQC